MRSRATSGAAGELPWTVKRNGLGTGLLTEANVHRQMGEVKGGRAAVGGQERRAGSNLNWAVDANEPRQIGSGQGLRAAVGELP